MFSTDMDNKGEQKWQILIHFKGPICREIGGHLTEEKKW